MKELIFEVLTASNFDYQEELVALFSPDTFPAVCVEQLNKKPVYALLSPDPTSYKYGFQMLYMAELELDYLAFKDSLDLLITNLRAKFNTARILDLKIDSKINTDKDYYKAIIKIEIEEVS